MNNKIKLSHDFSLTDLYVEITNKCNLFCKYCCRNSHVNDECEMSIELFEKILIDSHKIGCHNITLTGGEALLHHNFVEIIRLCRTYGFNICLLTNGIDTNKLPKYLWDEIAKIQVSIDGGGAQYNDKTRGNGTFEKIITSIKKLLKDDVSAEKISLKMTITHENINGIADLIQFANQYGITNVGFSFLYKAGRAMLLDENLFVTDDDKGEIKNILDKARQQYSQIDIQYPGYTNRCPLLNEDGDILIMPRIDCKGKVYACQMFSDDFWIGDVNSEELLEIINGSRFERLRLLAKYRESFITECITCKLNKKCGRGCVAVSLYDGVSKTDRNCYLRKAREKEEYIKAIEIIKKKQELLA